MSGIALRDAVGLAGQGMLAAVAVLAFPGAARMPRKYRAASAFLVFAAALGLRLHGVSPAEFLRGAWGDISITTWALLLSAASGRLAERPLLPPSARTESLVFACLAAFALYPMALGLTSFDPYALGYRPLPLVLPLAALSAWAWARGSALAWVLVAAALAFDAGLLESGNLWDYLVDPLVFLYAMGVFVARAIRRAGARRLPSTLPPGRFRPGSFRPRGSR